MTTNVINSNCGEYNYSRGRRARLDEEGLRYIEDGIAHVYVYDERGAKEWDDLKAYENGKDKEASGG